MTEPCPRCLELEAKVAELEARLSASASVGEFRAFRMLEDEWGQGWELRPSPLRRAWMDDDPRAYQCLPMLAANQWGWQVLGPADVRVTWDGSPDPAGLQVEVPPPWDRAIKSQFGRGIVIFSPPWMFRTPPGWDLYAKGPSNRWKANCSPLEGVIETWWPNDPSTLNWKLMGPGEVWFVRGESVGQLMPVPHATFEGSSAFEAWMEESEPESARELVRRLEGRRRIARTPVPTHRLDLKGEDVEGHATKIPVPPVRPRPA